MLNQPLLFWSLQPCLQWPFLPTQLGSFKDTSGPAKYAETCTGETLQWTGRVCRASSLTDLRPRSFRFLLCFLLCFFFALSFSLSFSLPVSPCLSNNHTTNTTVTFSSAKHNAYPDREKVLFVHHPSLSSVLPPQK